MFILIFLTFKSALYKKETSLKGGSFTFFHLATAVVVTTTGVATAIVAAAGVTAEKTAFTATAH